MLYLRDEQPGAGRDSAEVRLFEQSEGIGVGVLGVVDDDRHGCRLRQCGGERLGHRYPVAPPHCGQRLRIRLTWVVPLLRRRAVLLQGLDQS
ncbi:hypothetical protein OHA62_47030 [Streptomyces sp. NBC_00343]|nr:hypothetical protein [Streptomyces sp. NBC_00343]